MKQTRRLSIDTVLLLVLGTASISLVSQFIGALVILTIGSYALLDTLSRVKTIDMSLQRVFNLKLPLVMLSIFLVTVLTTVSAILMRRATTPWQYIHDGAIQVEESIKYLLQGKNPYAENYLETPLAQWRYAFCLPLLIFLLWRQLAHNTVKQCWLGYGLLLLTFTFFSRFFSQLYLGIIVHALALGYLPRNLHVKVRT